MWAQSAAELGNIVATARRHRGLTQAKLARALGVTQYWISEIERGKERAQVGKILRVLSYLGVRLRVVEAPWVVFPGRAAGKRAEHTLADILAAHGASTRPRKARRR